VSEPARHPYAVHSLTGEVLPDDIQKLKAEIVRYHAIIKGLERDIRGWAVRYRQLEEDRDVAAREHELWKVGEYVFKGWQRLCNHGRTHYTADRFWCAEPFLARPKYGETLRDRLVECLRAVKGAQFDPWRKPRKNGSVYVHDSWEVIFKSVGSYDEFRAKCPVGWVPVLSDELEEAVVQAERVLARLREAGR
jgi:hypothetical protein